MAITYVVTGRKRRGASLDAHGDPVVTFDTTPLRLMVSNEAAAKAEARFLVPELADAPDATIEEEGKPQTKQSLHDWLAAAGVIAPRVTAAPVAPKPAVHPVATEEVPQLGH